MPNSRNSREPDPSKRASETNRPAWQELSEKKSGRKKPKRSSQGNRRGQAKRSSKPKSKPKSKSKRREKTAEIVLNDERMGAIPQSFAELTDPRVNRRRRHLLIDIVVIALCATIGGAENWKDMTLWGNCRRSWLQSFLELPNGIPSKDTFRRVISRLDPDEFQACFLRFISTLSRQSDGRIVAIDGKTLRRSKDGASNTNPLHIVSAWCAEQHLTLGQRAVDEKSNEITAIPELLKLLELHGAFVTIDAMGCQKNIAKEIIDQKGQYCLAVKGNQEHLHEDISNHFNECLETDFEGIPHDFVETREKGHGREETRWYYTTEVPASLRNSDSWEGLKSIGIVIGERILSEKTTSEVRYYINSFASDAKVFARAVRSHWSIENSLHWIMDVTFDEDQCRIRKDSGAENVSWLRRIAISLLKNESTIDDTIRAKRQRAAWDIHYLEAVLLAARPEI